MKIEKEYNIEQLSNILKTRIAEYQVKPSFKTVSLDVLTAQRIVDVLETLASWENKSSKSNDVAKEELEDNRNCFGYCVEDDYVCTHCADYEKCRKETNKIKSSGDKEETNSKSERRDCFGAYDGDIECECCDSKKECKKRKERLDCFGCHIDGDEKCNLCVYEKECMIETKRSETLCDDCLMKSCCKVDCTHEHITEQMLGNLVKCFGKSYRRIFITACETCKYAEQCRVLTKHE